MDKYEYKLKLEEIETLAGEKNYAAAAEIADSINWRKVRNVNSLMLVGEIYQQTGRYEDSKELLLMAYDRSPIGKKIIYRLAEIAIEAGQFDEAQEYYDEFVEIAPHDTLKYVLRYRLSQAKGEPITSQIAILSELKEQEYTEEWAFELAYLFHQAGMTDKCIEACDELILWFGDGPYVEKALELKMLYQPLSPDQEEKYKQFRKKRDGIIEVRPDEYLESGEIINNPIRIPEVHVNADRFNTQNLQEELARGMQQIMEATEKETVHDTMDSIKKMVEEIPYLQPLLAEEGTDTQEQEPLEYETDEEIDGSINLNFQEILEEEYDGQISLALPPGGASEPQVSGQMTIEDVLADWEKTRRAAEAVIDDATQRKLASAKKRALQQTGDLMERLAAVIPHLDAGATTKDLVEQTYGEVTPESVERTSRALANANECLQREIDRLQGEQAIAAAEPVVESGSEMAAVEPAQEPEPAMAAAEPVQEPEPAMAAVESVQNSESVMAHEEPVTEPELAMKEVLKTDEMEAGPAKKQRKKFDEIDQALAAELEAEGLQMYQDPKPKRSNVKGKPKKSGVRRELSHPADTHVKKAFPDISGILSTTAFTGAETAVSTADLALELMRETAPEQPVNDTSSTEGIDTIDQVLSDWEAMKDPTTPLPEISMDLFEDPVEPPLKKADTFNGIKKLDAEMSKRFSYFAKVDGMEAQICRALTGCGAYLAGVNHDRFGNLIIEGASGCGKTMLATNLVKTLQQMVDKPGKQIGKINGDALNHKDIPALMGKISGGCLIIEHVGELTRDTESKLSAYLEQHPAELLVILEDDKDNIVKALSRHEGFAAKFGERITIPYFTNDELVEFARTYAQENGYGIDAMAVLALYTRISNIQKLDQATTLVEVKEIVDEAIDRVEKGSLKKMFGILTSKRYDENNYVVLREKDFEE
ncbi:MAG: tetratricopeptide repeat protein [Lachnospiraceae bacterium]|nr:tetratricopeptide repeat protein [bacterium]MDY5517667.1 tetratricopeptide repeat protein [Lachnospiraceae bacterium]